LRRPILLVEAGDAAHSASFVNDVVASAVPLSGTNYTLQGIHFGIDARFAQSWNLLDVTIGDLATTVALAPLEQLTVEVLTSQRKVLDQSAMDSTESVTSDESTTSDKEAVNVVRSASKTENWHVDGTASVNVGYASASISAGYAKSVTESNQQTINHVSEATRRSAKNLKMLHSVTVRGVTETFTQSRMTRVLRNPYSDRTLAVNVFQLLKNYSVRTDLTDQRAAIVIRFASMIFDGDFILNHVSFLQQALLEPSMADNLMSAVQGAKPVVQSGARDTALLMSKMALNYLFNLKGGAARTPANILSLPTDQDPANAGMDQNDPLESFATRDARASGSEGGLSTWQIVLGVLTGGASLTAEAAVSAAKDFLENEQKVRWSSGFDTAVRTKASALFATLAFFNAIVRESVLSDSSNAASPLIPILDKDISAILLANALSADLSAQWKLLYPDPLKSDELHAMMSSRNYTEVFRRVPGFLAMTREIVRPLVEPAGADAAAISAHNQDVFALNRLIGHLNIYSEYYTSQFLEYVSRITNGESIAQFARQALENVEFSFNFDVTAFDPDRAFISKRAIVIPGFATLSAQDVQTIGRILGAAAPVPTAPNGTVDTVEVPCDGTHLEAVAGACVLANVSAQPSFAQTVNAMFGRPVL